MAATVRGEAPFTHEGMTYLFLYDFNALCVIEEELDRPIDQVMKELGSGSVRMRTMRAIVWAGLKARQPDVTVEEAGSLIIGNMAGISDAMSEALKAALPQAKEGDSHPPKARKAGAGKAS